MAKKGITQIFEQFLLFFMGLAILIASFAIFTSYEIFYSQSVLSDQAESLSEYLVSNIVMLSNDENTNSTIEVSVPITIGNENYIIDLEQEGLNITTFTTKRTFFTSLNSINHTFTLSGRFSTLHGSSFIIYKRENQIIIG